MYRHHKLSIYVNGTWFHDILIDEHVFERHGESITESLVLQLVSQLHEQRFVYEDIDEKGFQYFVNNELKLPGYLYRLVWFLPPDKDYLGVRTAFRRKSHGN